ncbi:MAG: ATP-binding cassette domain-containing protein [Chloroflexi bacterium]|nr:ATP-binding cassette domain-containing protein [Chloroflexota bacterium]
MALEVADLRVERAGRAILAVPRLAVEAGEVLAVLGPNGAGKSTLLRCLALLERPTAGAIRFLGRELSWRDAVTYRRRTATLFQEPLLLDTTVEQNVATGLRLRGVVGKEITRRVGVWLERLGITLLARRAAHTLSSGEARRVSLARALVLDPEVLFLDEPFAALDVPARAAFARELAALLDAQRTTTVLVTHDRAEVQALADRVAVLLAGEIVELGAVERVFAEPRDPRAAAFLRAAELPQRRRSNAPCAMLKSRTGEERLWPER